MTTEEKAAEVLRSMGTVRYISIFGKALLDSGVMQPKYKGKRHRAQGYALLAGKWLRLMQRQGLAVETPDGWRAVDHVQPNP